MPVDLTHHEGVALLTLNRPDAFNAMSPEMLGDLDGRLDEIEDDSDVRAVVVTGAGEKAFCAGADVREMLEISAMEARGYAQRGQAVARRIERLGKPVIAAVNGLALGGGCELALACDFRVAAETAAFGQPEVKLGILPGWGGTQRLARITSPGFAKEMILTGRPVKADVALRAGLANHVYPLADLLDEALALAGAIASGPSWAISAAKQLCNLATDADLDANLDREADVFGLAFTVADQREGMAAFVEKREPNFARD
jgi:enoyl-CoA hydratase